MKYFVLITALLGVSLTLLSGCKKDDEKVKDCEVVLPTPVAQEMTTLENYLQINHISNAIKSEEGFYYIIEEPGTGDKPQDKCAQVLVNYKGSLINGVVFDQNTNQNFLLSGTIKGWQAGLRLIGEGGKIKLFLPPALGYGVNGSGQIPGNSILIFEVDLIKLF